MSVFNRLFGKKEPQRQPLDPNQFLRAFEQFVNARTWTESQHIVEQQAILLHPDGDDLLRQLAADQPEAQARQVVEEHRALLRRCREAGIPRAFAEQMLPAEALEQNRRDLEQLEPLGHKDLLERYRAASAWLPCSSKPANQSPNPCGTVPSLPIYQSPSPIIAPGATSSTKPTPSCAPPCTPSAP